MEKRRIAVVASTFGVGGAEIVTGNVLRRLPKDRYDVRLFFLHDAGVIGRDLFAELRYQYVITFEPGTRPGWHPLEVRTRNKNLTVHARSGYITGPARSDD